MNRLMGIVCIGLMAVAVSPTFGGGTFQLLVNKNHCDGGHGIIGGFGYDPVHNLFATGMFGSGTALRAYDPETNTSDTYASPTALELFGRSSDPLNGITDANDSGNMYIFCSMFNPLPLNIDGNTYEAGDLVYVLNYCDAIKDDGITPHMEWTKAIFRWDLRKIGTTTTLTPDYDNAQNGVGVITGSLGIVDWNDALAPVASNQDFIDAAQAVDPAAAAVRPYIGRQFAWTTDGYGLIVTSHGTASRGTGGLYYVDAISGDTTYIHPQAKVYCEPFVVHSSIRNLGAGDGDQILYGGTDFSDQWTEDGGINDGGLSFVVMDEEGYVSGEQILISGNDMRDYLERKDSDDDGNITEESDVRSGVVDSQGNIYFYEIKSGGLHMLDTKNRLACIANNAEVKAFARTVDGSLSSNGGMYRLQTREIEDGLQIMYRGDNAYIAGITVDRIGDFDKDGDIDDLDTGFFLEQLDTPSSAIPVFADGQPFLDYIAADLNGTSSVGTDGSLELASVTWKDMEILKQFVRLETGDLDWNGVIDRDDFAILAEHLDAGSEEPASAFEGDLNGDGTVNLADYAVFQCVFGKTYELDRDIE